MTELVKAKEAQERKAQEELLELEELRTHLLESTRARSATPTAEAGSAEVAGELSSAEDAATASRAPHNVETEALNVRVEQGLRTLLAQLAIFVPQPSDDGSCEDDDASATDLQTLFHHASKEISRLRENAASARLEKTPAAADPTPSAETHALPRSELQTPLNKKKSPSSSLKRLLTNRRSVTGVDVTKLVGYVDEDQATNNRKREAGADDGGFGDDGIVERSFLKARSMRLTMRHQKKRDP